MQCLKCKFAVPKHARNCPVCQEDVGFPNVRIAYEEKEALNERIKDAEISCTERNCKDTLFRFGEAVSNSKAVICKNIGVASKLISSDTDLYITFYGEVRAGSRLPENNKYDRGRPAVDGTLFPHYHEHISFCALTLDRIGSTFYGEYSITLKDELIKHRASVFEENAFFFCQKHMVIVGDPIPKGFRSEWADRDKLAMAKLHSKIDSETKDQDFINILMSHEESQEEADFIEVHIYGPIHRRTIEHVIGVKPKRSADRPLFESMRKKLEEVNVTLEVR